MSPFALISFYKFARDIRDSIPSDDFREYGLDENQLKSLQTLPARIMRDFKYGFIVICVVLPLLVNLKTRCFDPIQGDERWIRYWFPWMYIFGSPVFGLALGFGNGLLRLPAWYLHSPLGDRWKVFVGVRSVSGVKVVSLLLCGSSIDYAVFLIWMSDKTGAGVVR